MADDNKSTELEALSDNVVNKYISAGKVVNDVLKQLIEKATTGNTTAGDLCALGDELLTKALANQFKNNKSLTKGIAMPTCVSVNNVVCHFSPLPSREPVPLKEGQIVKIDLGAHIDGYMACAAHTVVVGRKPDEKAAKVVLAAANALECAVRSLFPSKEKTNIDVSNVITEVGNVYGAIPVENMISHQVGRFDHDAGKQIIQNLTNNEQLTGSLDKATFKNDEVYVIEIFMSTGDGKAKRSDERVTVYRQDDDVTYQLKMKHSRTFFSDVVQKANKMPFSIRSYPNEAQAKVAVTECESHGLLNAYPILVAKPDDLISHFKATVLLTPAGILKVAGLPLDTENYKSTVELPAALKTLANESLKVKKQKKKAADNSEKPPAGDGKEKA